MNMKNNYLKNNLYYIYKINNNLVNFYIFMKLKIIINKKKII